MKAQQCKNSIKRFKCWEYTFRQFKFAVRCANDTYNVDLNFSVQVLLNHKWGEAQHAGVPQPVLNVVRTNNQARGEANIHPRISAQPLVEDISQRNTATYPQVQVLSEQGNNNHRTHNNMNMLPRIPAQPLGNVPQVNTTIHPHLLSEDVNNNSQIHRNTNMPPRISVRSLKDISQRNAVINSNAQLFPDHMNRNNNQINVQVNIGPGIPTKPLVDTSQSSASNVHTPLLPEYQRKGLVQKSNVNEMETPPGMRNALPLQANPEINLNVYGRRFELTASQYSSHEARHEGVQRGESIVDSSRRQKTHHTENGVSHSTVPEEHSKRLDRSLPPTLYRYPNINTTIEQSFPSQRQSLYHSSQHSVTTSQISPIQNENPPNREQVPMTQQTAEGVQSHSINSSVPSPLKTPPQVSLEGSQQMEHHSLPRPDLPNLQQSNNFQETQEHHPAIASRCLPPPPPLMRAPLNKEKQLIETANQYYVPPPAHRTFRMSIGPDPYGECPLDLSANKAPRNLNISQPSTSSNNSSAKQFSKSSNNEEISLKNFEQDGSQIMMQGLSNIASEKKLSDSSSQKLSAIKKPIHILGNHENVAISTTNKEASNNPSINFSATDNGEMDSSDQFHTVQKDRSNPIESSSVKEGTKHKSESVNKKYSTKLQHARTSKSDKIPTSKCQQEINKDMTEKQGEIIINESMGKLEHIERKQNKSPSSRQTAHLESVRVKTPVPEKESHKPSEDSSTLQSISNEIPNSKEVKNDSYSRLNCVECGKEPHFTCAACGGAYYCSKTCQVNLKLSL